MGLCASTSAATSHDATPTTCASNCIALQRNRMMENSNVVRPREKQSLRLETIRCIQCDCLLHFPQEIIMQQCESCASSSSSISPPKIPKHAFERDLLRCIRCNYSLLRHEKGPLCQLCSIPNKATNKRKILEPLSKTETLHPFFESQPRSVYRDSPRLEMNRKNDDVSVSRLAI